MNNTTATQRVSMPDTPALENRAYQDEIVIRPLRSVSELRGMFRHCAAGRPMDWEKARTATERAVAEEVAGE